MFWQQPANRNLRQRQPRRVCHRGRQMEMCPQNPRKGPQIRHSTRESIVHFKRDHVFRGFPQRLGCVPHVVRQCGQRSPRQNRALLHILDHPQRGFAAIHHLAANQIHRLNAIGAFIDRGHPHIAGKLCRPGFLDKPHAAMHLNAHLRHVIADIGAKGLGNWCQQSRPCQPIGRSGRPRHINRHRTRQRNCPR